MRITCRPASPSDLGLASGSPLASFSPGLGMDASLPIPSHTLPGFPDSSYIRSPGTQTELPTQLEKIPSSNNIQIITHPSSPGREAVSIFLESGSTCSIFLTRLHNRHPSPEGINSDGPIKHENLAPRRTGGTQSNPKVEAVRGIPIPSIHPICNSLHC